MQTMTSSPETSAPPVPTEPVAPEHPVLVYHRRAQALAAQADAATRAGQPGWAQWYLRGAAPLAAAAALLYAMDPAASEPQRSRLCQIGANLCLAIGERRMADLCCATALAGAPTPQLRAEIEALIVRRPLLLPRPH